MPAIPALLIAASALLLLALGVMHLTMTYRGSAFHPRDPALFKAMQADSPRITRATTMWRSGVGFHASHSLGVMFFGVLYAYLALEGSGFLFRSAFLMGLGMLVLCAYLLLARLYWFKAPFRAIFLAAGLYAGGLVAVVA